MAKKTLLILLTFALLLPLLGCQARTPVSTFPYIPGTGTTAPTTAPTTLPTSVPTTAPTTLPTTAPTTAPTTMPTTAPTTVPTTAPTQPVDPSKLWTPICQEYINLRATPGGTLIGTVPVGAQLVLLGWHGTHALVKYGDTQGYVAANYIQPADSAYIAKQLQVVPFTNQYSYAQMLSDMELLQAMYPNLVKIDSIGSSELGRNIPVMRLGDPNAKYHVLIQGAMHGREHATAWLVMAIADHALSQKLLADQSVCYHLIPMSNPDGVVISQTQTLDTVQSAIYETDLAKGYAASAIARYAQQWKANGLGVDLNRNFPSGWEKSLEHTQPSSEKYRGESALCAAESKALAAYTQSRHFDMTLSIHAYGSVLYYQYGNKQPVNRLSYNLALAVEQITGYIPVGSDGTSGAGYKDWAMDALGIPSLTIEIGSTEPPLAQQDLYNTFARFEELLPVISQWLKTNG